MGNALKYLRELLEKFGLELDRKTATSLLVLLLILILLPAGLFLIRNQLTFIPRAAGELIQLGEGGCIKLDKNKKKVVDCPTVPLKLINPFFSGSGSPAASTSSPGPSSSTGASVNPSPTAGACATSVTTGAELLTAVNCYKNAGVGGRISLPAGSIEVNKKISVPSGVTIAGAGISATTIRMSATFLRKTTPESEGDDALMANDSSHGQENIVLRDFTLQGDGQRTGNSCCNGLKLQNLSNSFVVNVGVNNFGIDGIYMGKRPNKPGTTRVRVTGCSVNGNGRNGITLADGIGNVIDHCSLSGNSTNEPVAAIDVEPDNGSEASDNQIFENSISGNRNNGIQITQNPHDPGGLVLNNSVCSNTFGGNGGTDFDDKGFGTKTSGCSAGNLTPPTAQLNFFPGIMSGFIKTANAQDSDDNFIDGEDSDSNDQFTSTASATPVSSASTGPTSAPASNVLQYRLAESQAGLAQAPWKQFAFIPPDTDSFGWLTGLFGQVPEALAQDSDDNFIDGEDSDSNDQFVSTGSSTPVSSTGAGSSSAIGPQFINTTYVLKDTKPGTKQIWVEYKHPDGATRVGSVTFDLVDKTPQILGLSCNLDISKQGLKITVNGNHFGNDTGKATAEPSGNIEVLSWNNTQVTGLLKSPNIPVNQGQRFKIKVARPDGFESGTAVCAVDKSLISFGAKIFCREPGKFDASDVTVTLLYNPDETNKSSQLSKVEEKVTINKDGEIDNLKTQLQVGKNYAISVKAPNTLRRGAIFTAMEGTTEIIRPDGTPFILPIGDIAPRINYDGQINTLDRAELIRQWRVLGSSSSGAADKLTGDFNRDSKVNSIDWACMQFDFGSSDDPIPAEVPGSSSGSIQIPDTASDTLFIPVSSPSPSPSPVTELLQKAKILLIS